MYYQSGWFFCWMKTPAGWGIKPLFCHQEKNIKYCASLWGFIQGVQQHEQRTGCHWPTITSVHGASVLNASCSISAWADQMIWPRDAVVWWLSVAFLQCNWLRLIFLYSGDDTHLYEVTWHFLQKSCVFLFLIVIFYLISENYGQFSKSGNIFPRPHVLLELFNEAIIIQHCYRQFTLKLQSVCSMSY